MQPNDMQQSEPLWKTVFRILPTADWTLLPYLVLLYSKDDDDFSFDTGMDSIILTFTESGEQCINVSIVTDNLMETSEHFSVVMGSRDDRVKLNNSISRIDIIDDSEGEFK